MVFEHSLHGHGQQIAHAELSLVCFALALVNLLPDDLAARTQLVHLVRGRAQVAAEVAVDEKLLLRLHEAVWDGGLV